MNAPQRKSPNSVTTPGRGFKTFQKQESHSTKKLPPYGTRIDPALKELAILTGSDAWDRAKADHWQCMAMILPLGDDPSLYAWPVSGKDCRIIGFGEPESREKLNQLSVELIRAGANVVYWRGQFEIDDNGEPHLIDACLSDPLSPVFRAHRGVKA